MAQMNLHSFDKYVDELYGKTGTPERDAIEARLKEEAENFFVGEAIREARLKQNLTQEQLGERIGVQKAQISKFEKGENITLTSLRKIFRALGEKTGTLALAGGRTIALW